MITIKKLATALSLAGIFGVGTAHANTMTFDALVNNSQHAFPYTENGITLGTLSPNSFFAQSGTRAQAGEGILLNGAPTTMVVTFAGAPAFNVNSIAFNDENPNGPQTVTFTGFYAAGGTIVETRVTDGNVNTYEVFNPTGNFSGLSSLRINTAFTVWDNISVTPVPEPETYAMMLAGLGMLGFAARRRKPKELAAI